jgi:hypothetical protein
MAFENWKLGVSSSMFCCGQHTSEEGNPALGGGTIVVEQVKWLGALAKGKEIHIHDTYVLEWRILENKLQESYL